MTVRKPRTQKGLWSLLAPLQGGPGLSYDMGQRIGVRLPPRANLGAPPSSCPRTVPVNSPKCSPGVHLVFTWNFLLGHLGAEGS